MITRRHALKATALAAAGFSISTSLTRALAQAAAPAPAGPHTLPPLGYAYDALEPHFDKQTMEIHHGKHHKAYVDNLNKAIADQPDLQKLSAEELLKNLNKVPEKIRTAVRNNAGGHYNHSLFWQSLVRDGKRMPEGRLGEALQDLFEDPEKGQERFLKEALGRFGSGWIWLSLDKDKKLVLETSPNQDNPLLDGRTPLVGLDLWEHAYYLKYQNRRADYVKAFYNVINWEFVESRYEKLT
jgi:Fe-Mn family superoxide dismutase